MTYENRFGRVIRTAFSMERKDMRDVWKAPDRPWQYTAQSIADEKYLSRSKQYFNKGVNESARRLRQMAKQ